MILPEDRTSLDALIKAVLREKNASEKHKRRCLRKLLAWRSELGGKHKTPYRTRRVCDLIGFSDIAVKKLIKSSPVKIEVEHVFPIKKTIDYLLNTSYNEDFLNENLTTCLITKEEHLQLNAFDQLDGWDRYKAAGIVVVDINEIAEN
tara:strand:+ start:98 stop:541 length:444 start_codon:yes stop_codon:yes gene_type:complete